MNFEDWKTEGWNWLNNKQWGLGDWWNSGDFEHGERKAFVESVDWAEHDGPSYQTCKHAGATAKAFPEKCRRRHLSFGVAQTIKARPEYAQEAIDDGWTVRTARDMMRELREKEDEEKEEAEQAEADEQIAEIEAERAEVDKQIDEIFKRPVLPEKVREPAPLPVEVTPAPKGIRVVADRTEEIENKEGCVEFLEEFKVGLGRAAQEAMVATMVRGLEHAANEEFLSSLDDDLYAEAMGALNKYEATKERKLKIVK